MSYIKKSSKIFFFLILILLFFGLALVYNQSRELEAQEISLTCGEEIPLGEAIDGALALIGIEEEVITFFSASISQIEAAKQLFELSGQCEAENCDADCKFAALAPAKIFAGNENRDVFSLIGTQVAIDHDQGIDQANNKNFSVLGAPATAPVWLYEHTNYGETLSSLLKITRISIIFLWQEY